MTIVEMLVRIAGPPIARMIFKIWLSEPDSAEEVTASVVEIIKHKTSDIVAQQKAKRQFEEIGEKVALNLMSFFEMEGIVLAENQQLSIADAVCTAISQTKITTELVIVNKLDPTLLAKHIMQSYPQASRQFSAEEFNLFRRIIFESSSCIVDIASQLPAFTERVFSEVLKRENEILSVANQILHEIQTIRANHITINPQIEEALFETDYCRAVTRKLDVLELFGVTVSSASRRHRLSVAYISLTVTQHFANKDTKISLPAEEALADSSRILIRGAAGAGKTTLLKWIAVRSASKSFEHPLSHWNDSIPFFIRLREFSESSLPNPSNFLASLFPVLSDIMPNLWTHKQLRTGKAIILIDGIDELPKVRRAEVKAWLMELTNTYKKAKFIVTSRPSAIEEGWIKEFGFMDAELQPMELNDVSNFIDHWHKAVNDELISKEEKLELEVLADHLKAVVRSNRQIAYLSTSPLLCSMLCALHRDRNKQIPSDRIELYEAYTYMLLERRDVERGIVFNDYPKLTYRQKQYLIQDMAYWMLLNSWSSVSFQSAVTRLQHRLKNMRGIDPNINASHLLEFLVERSGVLREPSVGMIDFTHRTFFEFMSAQAVLDAGDIGILLKESENDQWREVIILAVGLASNQAREEIIDGLVQKGDTTPRFRHRLHLLAVACLETTINLGADTAKKVEQRLIRLVPPRDNEQAQALSSAGDLATPYLRPYLTPSNEKIDTNVIASCIRALALIGTDEALSALAEYNHYTEQPLLIELLRAWDFFDRDDFAKRVLTKVTRLNLAKVPSLNRVEYLTNLESLSLASGYSIFHLEPLQNLVKLKSLRLHDCFRVTNLDPLKNLQELQFLQILECEKLENLQPLQTITNLETLHLSASKVNNLTPLSDLKNLKHLKLESCSRLRNLKPLSKLTDLQVLSLVFATNIVNIDPLHDLTNLTHLDIRGCLKIKNFHVLTNLPNLKVLNMRGISHNNVPLNKLKGVQVIR